MTTTQRSNGNDTNLNDLALATPAYYDVLKKKHFSSPQFDCVAFTRAVSKCAELLDPTKFLLTKLDLDCSEQLLGVKEEVQLLAAYIKYVVDLYESLPSRKEQIAELLRSLVGKTHDFTVVESFPEYVELQDYAQSMDELTDRWRRLVKLYFLATRDTTTTTSDVAEELLAKYTWEPQHFTSSSTPAILETILQSLTSSLDPHSRITFESLASDSQGSIQDGASTDSDPSPQLTGIGIIIEQNEDGFWIGDFFTGAPAERYGEIHVGDRIVSVTSNGKLHTTDGLTLDELRLLIRGQEGTAVTLGISSGGQEESKNHTITREIISWDTDRASGQIIYFPEHDGFPDATLAETRMETRIGYIDIPSFNNDTPTDVEKILTRFSEHDVDVVLVDLTRNPGGFLSETIGTINLFMDKLFLGYTVNNNGKCELISGCREGGSTVCWRGPTVLLTSNDTASASEMMAAAFKNYRRALILGEKTFGKGTSQKSIPFGGTEGVNLRLTTEQFLSPDEKVIQHSGVTPDVSLLTSLSCLRESDRPDSLAPVAASAEGLPCSWLLIDGSKWRYDFVDDEIASQLNESCTKRTEQIAQFAVLNDLAEERRSRKLSERTIPLHEEEFKQWSDQQMCLSQLSPISEEVRERPPTSLGFYRWVLSDPTRKEALRVAAEYAALLRMR